MDQKNRPGSRGYGFKKDDSEAPQAYFKNLGIKNLVVILLFWKVDPREAN